jgi:REP element-mobilizing transposase RayT
MSERLSRKSARLPFYEYNRPGGYFITICSHERLCLFGAITESTITLSPTGQLVQDCWLDLPNHHKLELDYFIVMPNHVHSILMLTEASTAGRAPTLESFQKPVVNSVPTIIRSYKSAVTKAAREHGMVGIDGIWQRGYFERVLRNEHELIEARKYIEQNPQKWKLDQYHQ